MTSSGRPARTGRAGVVLFIASLLSACYPAFDWRESRPPDSGAVMMFPCRPDRQQRTATFEASALPMQLHSCKAAGSTFSLSVVDVDDPLRVSSLSTSLRQHLVANVAGTAAVLPLPRIVGATPNPQSQF